MAMVFYIVLITRAPDIRVHRAGSQLKKKDIKSGPQTVINISWFFTPIQWSVCFYDVLGGALENISHL